MVKIVFLGVMLFGNGIELLLDNYEMVFVEFEMLVVWMEGGVLSFEDLLVVYCCGVIFVVFC